MRFLLLLVLLSGCAAVERTSPDAASVRRALETNDLFDAYSVTYSDSCKIYVNVEKQVAEGEYTITAGETCSYAAPASTVWNDYRALFRSVFAAHDPKKLNRIVLHNLHPVEMWDRQMAVAGLKSPVWKKRSGKKNTPNNAFVQIFNENKLGEQVHAWVAPEGLSVELAQVEKVFQTQAKKLPFAKEVKELKKSKVTVPYSAGVYIFSVKPNN